MEKYAGLFRMAVLIPVCLFFLQSEAAAGGKKITILHTNDIHAAFLPHRTYGAEAKKGSLIGGFNELFFAVDSLRGVKKWTLLLDAGDIMTGSPVTEYEYRGADGGALMEMMNLIGYDAWTPGNHDYDISAENLLRLAGIAEFTALEANVVDSTGKLLMPNSSYFILEKNGLKIGIIGIMSGEKGVLGNKRDREGIKVLPPIGTVQKWIDSLRSGTDLIVALTHEGVHDDSVLAAGTSGIDVIVGGHSHTLLKHPRVVNGVVIVQTGSNCENLGVLDLTVENRKVTACSGTLLPLRYNSDRKQAPLSLFIDSVKKVIDKDYSEVIGVLKKGWYRRKGESAVGNFITDAEKESAGADFALINNGGIRKNQGPGPLTKMDLFGIFPFRDSLVKFRIIGKQLREIIRYEIAKGPAIQTSGIRCRWRYGAEGKVEFDSFLVGGKPLDDDAIYTGATGDYFAGELTDYFGFEIREVFYTGMTVMNALEKRVRSVGVIYPAIEHRIGRSE